MDGTQAAVTTERETAPPRVDGLRRVIVEHVQPEIDGGRFPIKRTIGEAVNVKTDMFADGHDLLAGVLRYRYVGSRRADLPASAEASARPSRSAPAAREGGQVGPWREVPLAALGNDVYGASFTIEAIGCYEYTVEGWVDRFASWLKGLIAKAEAGQDVSSELLEGAELIQRAASQLNPSGRPKPAPTDEENVGAGKESVGAGFLGPSEVEGSRLEDRPDDALRLLEIADLLRSDAPQRARVSAARDAELRALMDARPDRSESTTYERILTVMADPVLARFGSWYEMFPRSCTPDPSRSATFREAEGRLPEIADMGFDVLYLPPIHPIGSTYRKGRNNSLTPEPDDPGSPWAIGSKDGGHTAIEPGLGTIEDFDRFVGVANRLGLEVALDIAFQASPDHPWVREHPEWFRHRPDGTIKYAENPPKKYQDIYPFDFETPAWESLWTALRDVFLFWIAHGVRIFRVDNPHTKSFHFWEWCIAEIQRAHPDAIVLSEAFTRPKVMRYLAKAGFTQSYTYFTWRNSAHELREYLTELTHTELQEYMRPNFFANTPDILHEYLQRGGRPAFEVRLILAGTLAASYGIYSGYELCENVPVREGSEEYLDSEKYQIKPRDWTQTGNLRELISRVNEIRRGHPALQQNATLAFYGSDNPQLLVYGKSAPASPESRGDQGDQGECFAPRSPRSPCLDRVFVVANTDPHWMQHGSVQLPIWELGIAANKPYIVEDLLDGAQYTWRGEWNYVKLDPAERMAHIFVIRDL